MSLDVRVRRVHEVAIERGQLRVDRRIAEVILDAGRVREQIPDRHRVPAVGDVRQVCADRIVDRQPSVLHEQHDGACRDGLRHRGDGEFRHARRWRVELDVRQAARARPDDGAVADDGERHRGNVLRRHLRRDIRVDGVDGRERRTRGQWPEDRRQQDCRKRDA
jgi:hypothetical protein